VKTLRTLFALTLLFAGLGYAVACREGDTITNVPPPAPPAPTTIQVAGNCGVDGSTIQCRDGSTLTPSDSNAQVSWTLRRGSAIVEGSASTSVGGNVIFGPGLAAGDYAVEQLVIASDGVTASASYSPLTVL